MEHDYFEHQVAVVDGQEVTIAERNSATVNYRKRKEMSFLKNQTANLFVEGFIERIYSNINRWTTRKDNAFVVSKISKSLARMEEYISIAMYLSEIGDPYMFETKYNSLGITKILKNDGFGSTDDSQLIPAHCVSYDNYTEWPNSKNIYMQKNRRREIHFNMDRNHSDAMGLLRQLPLNGLVLLEVRSAYIAYSFFFSAIFSSDRQRSRSRRSGKSRFIRWERSTLSVSMKLVD